MNRIHILIIAIILIIFSACDKSYDTIKPCENEDKELIWQYVGIHNGAIRTFDRDCRLTIEEQEAKCGCNFTYNHCYWD